MDDEANDRDDERQALASALSDPTVWAEPPAGLEAAIVAAVAAEASRTEAATGRAGNGQVSDPVAHREEREPTGADVVTMPVGGRRPWRGVAIGIVAGAAAAALVLAGAAVLGRDPAPDLEIAMAGTELAPGASAELQIDDTPQGTRLVLDVAGLPPAPAGSYYEAWLRVDADVGVSAGTFHLRGGDGQIELWAGVSIEDYPLVTVTIQEEAQSGSSGRVVLRALVAG